MHSSVLSTSVALSSLLNRCPLSRSFPSFLFSRLFSYTHHRQSHSNFAMLILRRRKDSHRSVIQVEQQQSELSSLSGVLYWQQCMAGWMVADIDGAEVVAKVAPLTEAHCREWLKRPICHTLGQQQCRQFQQFGYTPNMPMYTTPACSFSG